MDERDGEAVHRFSIEGGGLTARSWLGRDASRICGSPAIDAPLVLGFDRFDDYPAHSAYFGAVVGRYANRIRGGRFTIAGQRYQLDTQFSRQAHAAWRLARVSASGYGTLRCMAPILSR